MLVKCPGCLTTYRVGEDLVKSSKPAFRCSRCKLIFALELKSKNEAEAPRPHPADSIQRSTDSEPDLPFASSKEEPQPEKPVSAFEYFNQQEPEAEDQADEQKEEPSIQTSLAREFVEPKESPPNAFDEAPPSGDLDSLSPDTPEENAAVEDTQPDLGGSPAEEPSDRPPPQSFEEIFGKPKDDLPAPTEVPKEVPTPPTPKFWTLKGQKTPTTGLQEKPAALKPEPIHKSEPAVEPTFDALVSNEERREREVGADPLRGGGPISVIPYVSLFGFLLLGFSLVTLMHQTQPARLEAYLKPLPWFGSTLLKNKHLRHGVVVGSLQTGYQKILGNREVFVISGRIYNQNPVSIGEVQVEGQIHGSGGKELARQAISVGNPISSKIIRDMTVREIAILQRLRPQKKFEVAPQDSAAFTIVFLKPTKEIESFSCRVLSAKGST